MPHYYFDLKNGTAQRDHAGVDLSNDTAAVAHGRAIAAKVGADLTDRDHACHVSVVREDGHEVMRLLVGGADQASAPRLKKIS
ncbi:MAG: hypothetical protein ABWY14_00295 [Tardiphaga sp.]